MKFKVGDKVSFDTNQETIFGTVIDISVNWKQEKYYVEFKNVVHHKRMWMQSEELTLINGKEVVIFT